MLIGLSFYSFSQLSCSVCGRPSHAQYRTIDNLLYTAHSQDCRAVITFRLSRRRREMYCGHARLSAAACPTLLHEPGYNLGEW